MSFVLDDYNLWGDNALTDRQTDRQTDRKPCQRRQRKAREESGKVNLGNDRHYWETGEDVFNWWIEEYKRNVKGQITIDEWLKAESEEV